MTAMQWIITLIRGAASRIPMHRRAWRAIVAAVLTLGLLPVSVSSAACTNCFGVREFWSGTTSWGPNQPFFGRYGTYFADVNADDMADAIAVEPTNIAVRLSGNGPFLKSTIWSSVAYYDYGSIWTAFADVTGDHRADAIAVNSNGITVRRSTGAAFDAGSRWTLNGFYGNRGTFFADVTGDGMADAIVVNDESIPYGRVVVRRSMASAFGGNEEWTSNVYYGTRGTYFADVTGDGKADAIVVNEDGITVRRSDGSRFLPNETWTNNPYYGNRGTFFADVTGDRRADAIVVNEDGITVRRSDGSKFLPNETWSSTPYYGEIGTYFVNVDCARYADAVIVDNSGITVRRAFPVSYGCL
jgi:VCBS repeat protein